MLTLNDLERVEKIKNTLVQIEVAQQQIDQWQEKRDGFLQLIEETADAEEIIGADRFSKLPKKQEKEIEKVDSIDSIK